jgi:ABC-type multidrug transport system fused ATPase/permease subunit
LISRGEYSTAQFFIVFVAVIFSGEAAANFFQYSTSISKAQDAANYILWFRTLIPRINYDSTQEPDEKDGDGPAQVGCEEVEFAYSTRPNAKVLQGVNVDVSSDYHSIQAAIDQETGASWAIRCLCWAIGMREDDHDIPPRAFLRPNFRHHKV